ncbi:carbohydrate-binding family 9-like protein [Algivirga pacifica]|uniref:Carbohydrate-binding family 9-like protein n=1 Tax=Algivirga pacifica TaxID=1162670 RepID=A0ABP9DHX6_9BACT
MSMKKLVANQLPEAYSTLEAVKSYLSTQETFHSISEVNWRKDFPYAPLVSFQIAWSKEGLYLYYRVEEKHIKAVHTSYNEPVYKDSCVEMFISPLGNEEYYNFEFNCIGNILAGKKLRDEKARFTEQELSFIETLSSLPKGKTIDNQAGGRWDLTIFIPSWLIQKEELKQGELLKANFYKCGDALTPSHYLSWSPINTSKPSFHQPQFFGEVILN